ncbi:hypothetical protein ABEF93_006398 [Exophiala dermatitidis]
MSALIDAGTDISTPALGKFGMTALQYAAWRGHRDATGFLLEHGADVNAACAELWGLTALQAAAIQGHRELVGVLLNAGADPNAPPSREGGYTALAVAIMGNNGSIFWTLVEKGAKPTLTQWSEDSPLTEWAGRFLCYSDLVRVATEGRMDLWQKLLRLGLLLGAGADVGAVGTGGYNSMSALDLAAEVGHLDMAKLLLDSYQLKQGESLPGICGKAAALASRRCYWVIVDLLEDYRRDSPPPSRLPEEDALLSAFTADWTEYAISPTAPEEARL